MKQSTITPGDYRRIIDYYRRRAEESFRKAAKLRKARRA